MSELPASLLDKLPLGWYPSPPDVAANMQRQLALELPPGHLLDGIPVKVIAHRLGTDDILCWHVHDPLRFTVIHLTWSSSKQTDADFPCVERDGTFDDFLAYERRFFPSSSQE